MVKKRNMRNIKKKLKARNAFNILHSIDECHRDENGKFKKFNVYRFYFDRHFDIVMLWSFIFLSGITFLIATLFSPLDSWIKLMIISVTLTIALVMVLLGHEKLILMQRMNELLYMINKKEKK